VSSQQWDKSFASATKQSLVVGTKPQHQPKYAQINSYTATNGTEKDSNSFSNFNGFFDEPVPQGYESTDFPWASTRSTNSPTDDMQKDAFGFSSAGASRKGSLPASRHGFESTMLPQNTDAFARRASRQDISSVAANLRSFQLRPEAQEENFVTRPGLNTQNSSSFRRPSVQLTSNLWLSDASILQDLPNDYSSHGTYGASSSVNRSPTDEYNSLRQNGQLHGSNYAASAYDVQHNGHSNGVSHAVQGADMSFSQSRDQWQVPSSPYPTMVGNRNGLAFPAEHLQQQAMYMNGQYQYLANQARTGQYPAQMGFGYYAMPTAHPMANMLPQMAASTPTPAYTGTHKLTNTHSKGIQSSKLHEFHANNNRGKRYELKDVFGHVVEFSGDQQGSRFLQTKLESANSDEKATLFAEIMPNARQLMQDIYGNYVVQKLFEHGDQTQKKILANTLKGHIPALSMQPYGCRVVQKVSSALHSSQILV
jgi:mRNA-binding protein PUF3